MMSILEKHGDCKGHMQSEKPDQTADLSLPWSHKSYCRICHALVHLILEQLREKAYHRACAPSKDLDQTANKRSLIRIFAGRSLDSQECSVS